MGGAMFYLSKGLGELGIGPIGKVLAVIFAILCIGGSFGGGNSFQNSMSSRFSRTIPGFMAWRWPFLWAS
jgi:AGCS family alanine or glycine:cation symporter